MKKKQKIPHSTQVYRRLRHHDQPLHWSYATRIPKAINQVRADDEDEKAHSNCHSEGDYWKTTVTVTALFINAVVIGLLVLALYRYIKQKSLKEETAKKHPNGPSPINTPRPPTLKLSIPLSNHTSPTLPSRTASSTIVIENQTVKDELPAAMPPPAWTNNVGKSLPPPPRQKLNIDTSERSTNRHGRLFTPGFETQLANLQTVLELATGEKLKTPVSATFSSSPEITERQPNLRIDTSSRSLNPFFANIEATLNDLESAITTSQHPSAIPPMTNRVIRQSLKNLPSPIPEEIEEENSDEYIAVSPMILKLKKKLEGPSITITDPKAFSPK